MKNVVFISPGVIQFLVGLGAAVCGAILIVVWAFCLTFSTISCNDRGTNVLYSDPEGVAVRVGQSSILVTNQTTHTIYIFAVEKQANDQYVDWIQGCDSSNAITFGSTREIPYSKIVSYYKGCDAYLFWWNCAPEYNGHLCSMLVKTL